MNKKVSAMKKMIQLLLEVAKKIKENESDIKNIAVKSLQNKTISNVVKIINTGENTKTTNRQDYILSVILLVGYSTGECYSYSQKKQLIEYFEKQSISIEIWHITLLLTHHII